METMHPRELLGLLIVVTASLIALVYLFVRMARFGDRRHGHRDQRGPR
jgi:hypothetical protein